MDEPIDIKIPNIEKELNRLWKDSQAKKQVKACLFTLVIYAREPRRVQYLQELVDTILDKFPCRIIFIKGDKHAAQKYFHVDVSNVKSGNTQQGSVAVCDQISIEASKDQLFRVPFLITPLLVPDLPIYLLWGQNPFEENAIFPHLQPFASRVIFDSECSDDLGLFCREMQNNLNTLKMDVVDINWALVSNWRDMLFQLFDSEERIAELNDCKSIIINYNHSETDTVQHSEIRAIYLQGWLAARMKWRYRATETFQDSIIISYFGAITPVVIALAPGTYPDLPAGGIASIEIKLVNGDSFSITRKPDISQVIVYASSKEICQLPFTLRLPNVHKGLSFMREIFFSKPSAHYSDMLKIISQIDFKILNK